MLRKKIENLYVLRILPSKDYGVFFPSYNIETCGTREKEAMWEFVTHCIWANKGTEKEQRYVFYLPDNL